MQIPDLTQSKATGQGQLVKVAFRSDGREQTAFIYDIQVAFTIANSADAEVVERLIPGARDTYIRATESDDWKDQHNVVPAISGLRIKLTKADDGTTAIEGGAEVVGALLRSSKVACTLTLKLRCAGQTQRIASALAGVLNVPVELFAESSQQVLAFPNRNATVPVGAVVVAKDSNGATLWGRVHDTDPQVGIALLDIFGDTEVDVTFESITTTWALVPGDATETALLTYKNQCKKNKVQPNFRAITVAMGEAYATEPPTDNLHRLTAAIVERAVELSTDPVERPVTQRRPATSAADGAAPAQASSTPAPKAPKLKKGERNQAQQPGLHVVPPNADTTMGQGDQRLAQA